MVEHYLREWRELAELSQDDLGAALSLGKSAMSRVEKGERKLTYEKRVAFADLLSSRLGFRISEADLFTPPPDKDTAKKIRNNAPPPNKGDKMKLLESLIRPLVKEYGAMAVIEAATKADRDEQSLRSPPTRATTS